MKRSNAPIFWSLFGAGGVLSALCGPILVLIIGIAVPLGISLPPQALGYARMSAFVHTLFGKAFLFAIRLMMSSTLNCFPGGPAGGSAFIPKNASGWPLRVLQGWGCLSPALLLSRHVFLT
jgi:hypothetical protein